jgi:hypothetical protein
MSNLITFVKNERGVNIVHFDGIPLNGSLHGFNNNRILIYFDRNNSVLSDDILKYIHKEFTVIDVQIGESTKTQYWIEWVIKINE